MTFDPVETFGAHNMTPERKDQVIDVIQKLTLGKDAKRVAFLRWCDYLGIRASAEDLARVTERKPV